MASTPFKARTGLDVEGNIVLTGTVDGRDVSADGTKLDGIATNANKYVLPTASASTLGGIKVGSGLSISSGVLSATGGGDTVYTPDVWEVATAAGKTANGILALGSTTALINGTSSTVRDSDTAIKVQEAGIYEISYSIGLENGGTTKRQNPGVYIKAGPDGSTVAVDGSLNVTYLRLTSTDNAPNGSVSNTCYYDARVDDLIELHLVFTQPATVKDVDIVQHVSGLKNTISIRRIK